MPVGWVPKGSGHGSGARDETGTQDPDSESDSEEDVDPLYLQAGLRPIPTLGDSHVRFPGMPERKPEKSLKPLSQVP